MRIVFFGTPDFAVPSLQAIIGAGHEVCTVVTREDKPKGRGYEMMPTPVKEEALKHGIEVLHPVRMKDEGFLQHLRELKADAFVTAAFGRILPKELLDIPPVGCINVHGSLLPSYRGAAPIQWAVIDGREETGITTMLTDEGLDTGDIIKQYRLKIDPDETGGSLFDKLSVLGGEAITDTLKCIAEGNVTLTKQGETDTAYARMLTRADGDIDWSMSAVSIERLVRGLNPWPGAYTRLGDRTLKIWRAKAVSEKLADNPLCFTAGEGYLYAEEVQLEGRKRMSAEAFLLGYKG